MGKRCFLLFSICILNLLPQAVSGQRAKNFNNDWLFFSGSASGAEKREYEDGKWRKLNLPHDWSIEKLPGQKTDSVVGPFSRASAGGFATGQSVGGEGWYRKHFTLAKSESAKRVEIYFEGVYNQAEIWINGQKAYENVYGYTSFRFDITQYCKPAGEQNIIAVRVLNIGKNSRWYSGSGVYRHVWLTVTAPTYIDDWGTFITTEGISQGKAQLNVSTGLAGVIDNLQGHILEAAIISPSGKVVSTVSKKLNSVNGLQNIAFKLQVDKPVLWSPDTPVLYTAKITLKKSGKSIDELIVPFGIRTLKFSTDKGFELNGETLLLKGGCVHHDNGLLGAAAFDAAEERKVQLLKDSGYNAVRTSHNPMSESFMNACDRLGMLVINEAFDQWRQKKTPDDYHKYFNEWSAKDLKSLVLRDRNHPSVIMWSIGNEIPERITEDGKETAAYLKNEVLKYDATRPITAGVNKYWNKEHTEMQPLDNAMFHLDILGYNYMWRFYETEHKKYPERVMFGSESVAMEAAQNWKKVEELPYVIGDFTWTALDYLGESGLGNTVEIDPKENVHQFMGWPWFNAWCGDIDLVGVKKPQSYYRDVIWKEREISVAVETPVAEGKIRKVSFWGWTEESLNWTFPGLENKPLKVNVYSRAPRVRLYLNDKLLGEQPTDSLFKSSFLVPYQPGKLKAVSVFGGVEKVAAQLETVGTATKIKLTPSKTVLDANGQDLSYILIELTDEKGNVILTDDRNVKINIGGNATVAGSGNASPTDMASFGSLQPKLFKGRAMVILRSENKSSEATVEVSAEKVVTATLKITTETK